LAQAETLYEKNPDFIYRRIVDESILVPVRQEVADMDCVYTLNPVAAFIWERLEGRATMAELEAAIVARYDVDPAAAATDVLAFVQELEAAGAVRKV
jgi:hypothetical protein